MIGCKPQTVIEVVEVEVTRECEAQEPEEEATQDDALPEDVQRILQVDDEWVVFYDSSGNYIAGVDVTDGRAKIHAGIPSHIVLEFETDFCVFDMDGNSLGDCIGFPEGTDIVIADQRILQVQDEWVGFYDSSGGYIAGVDVADGRARIHTSIPNHVVMEFETDFCVFDMDGNSLGDCIEFPEGTDIIVFDQRILQVQDEWVGFYDSSGSYIAGVDVTDGRAKIHTSIPNHIVMEFETDFCVFDMDGNSLGGCNSFSEGAEIIPIP
jgi:hypothetical protein